MDVPMKPQPPVTRTRVWSMGVLLEMDRFVPMRV